MNQWMGSGGLLKSGSAPDAADDQVAGLFPVVQSVAYRLPVRGVLIGHRHPVDSQGASAQPDRFDDAAVSSVSTSSGTVPTPPSP